MAGFLSLGRPHRSTLRPPLRRGGGGATKKRWEEDVEDVLQAINAACRGGEWGRRRAAEGAPQ